MRNRQKPSPKGIKCGNDYAEYREARAHNMIRPGRCLVEVGDGSLQLSSERLQPAGTVISDTYGFCVGGSLRATTPVAVMGRVLATPLEAVEKFKVGDPVGTGPLGTVSLMSRNEVVTHPECVVGFVVEIPRYKYWGPEKVPVGRRLWIRLR